MTKTTLKWLTVAGYVERRGRVIYLTPLGLATLYRLRYQRDLVLMR